MHVILWISSIVHFQTISPHLLPEWPDTKSKGMSQFFRYVSTLWRRFAHYTKQISLY